jgi:hypothetical protein
MATATTVQAAMVVSEREEGWAERIKGFLLMKSTKPRWQRFLGAAHGFIAGF